MQGSSETCLEAFWHSALDIANKSSLYEWDCPAALDQAHCARAFANQNSFCNTEVEAMKFRPLHDRVVVRRIEEDTKTAGGIIIPDTAKEKPMQGEVVAVGPGARDESGKLVPLDVKKGDRVLFGKWSGTEVKIDGEELAVMKESDILGVIEGKGSVRAAA
jgi:chaperonin GroES